MRFQHHAAAFAVAMIVGLVVFFVSYSASVLAAISGAFLGSEAALSVFRVLVDLPLQLLGFSQSNGTLYAAAAWGVFAMAVVYVVGAARALGNTGENVSNQAGGTDEVEDGTV
jgi:hypothetical protein